MVLWQTHQNENIRYGGCGERGPPQGFLAGFSFPIVAFFSGIPAGRLPRGTPVVPATTRECDRNLATIGPTIGGEVGNAANLHGTLASRGRLINIRCHRRHPSKD